MSPEVGWIYTAPVGAEFLAFDGRQSWYATDAGVTTAVATMRTVGPLLFAEDT